MKSEWFPWEKFPQHVNRFRNRGASHLPNNETQISQAVSKGGRVGWKGWRR